MSNNDPTKPNLSRRDLLSTAAAATGTSAGGTSAIIVDNVSASAGQASSLYYSTLSNATCGVGGSTAGCAVHRTQSGVK